MPTLTDIWRIISDDETVGRRPFPYLVVHIVGPNIDKIARFKYEKDAQNYIVGKPDKHEEY
jgi:hypothetical protein